MDMVIRTGGTGLTLARIGGLNKRLLHVNCATRLSQLPGRNRSKLSKNEPIIQLSGSAFERDPQRQNTEPEPWVLFKQVLNF